MLLLVGKTLITLPQVLTYSAGTILIISFLHNFAFNSGTFFLALYYQVGLQITVITTCSQLMLST